MVLTMIDDRPHFSDDSVTLFHGDCLDVLAELPDNSVDSVVCDPPYGLEFMGKEWDAPWKTATGFDQRTDQQLAAPSQFGTGTPGRPYEGKPRFAARNSGANAQAGVASNGRAFQQWCEQWTAECLRVLKPGGHLLAFGGTRTWHRLAVAVEDAGFEVRDSIAWLYASGFPKSLDVGKAIDKRAEENAETKRRVALVAEVIRSHREAKGMERAEVSEAVVGTRSGACWNWEHQQLPSADMWPAIKAVLDIPDTFDGLIEGDRAQFIAAEREVIRQRTMTQGGGTSLQIRMGELREVNADITAPATPAAQQWQGWGTALKPAFEPIVVARKPLAGTVAANVLQWGTGALNIDATRVATPDGKPAWDYPNGAGGHLFKWNESENQHGAKTGPAGRWPTNVLLDGDAADALDAGSVTTGGTGGRRVRSRAASTDLGVMNDDGWTPKEVEQVNYGDTGGASRFFPVFRYQAKAPTRERVKVDGIAHPTIKPLALMQWLVRLVTPPGGVALDPFAGSGTTVEAAILEGFRCIAIEREADYLPLILARIERNRTAAEPETAAAEALTLFDLEEPA